MTTIRIRRSTVPGERPDTLASGEIAINEADQLLFYRQVIGDDTFVKAMSLAGRAWTVSARNPLLTDGREGDVWVNRTTGNYFTRDEGNWIPQGSITVGVPGPAGAAGTPGTRWFTGTVVPDSSTAPSAANGDFYLRNTNGDLYQLANNSWALVSNLKGSTGATGSTGLSSRWLSGAASPPVSVTDVIGDFFLNTTSGDVFRRAVGGWEWQINLKVGPAGPTGPTGPSGPAGPAGVAGPTGPAGPASRITVGTVTTGAAGTAAAATITGTAPNYALNLTIPRGDTGTASNLALSGLNDTAISGSAAGQFLRWNGTSWANANFVAADLPPSGVTAGTYGSGSTIPVVTVDASGRVTSVTTQPAGTPTAVTNLATGVGLTGGPITSTGTIALANTTVTPGTYGSATSVPVITIDQQGRVTSAATQAIAGGGGSRRVLIIKPENQNATTNVLDNDSALFFNMAANTTYFIEIFMVTTLASSAGVRATTIWPSGATGLLDAYSGSTFNRQTSSGQTVTGAMTNAGNNRLSWRGYIRTAASAGVFQVQWSTNSSTVGSILTISSGSYLTYEVL